jgi:hypothetical protein
VTATLRLALFAALLAPLACAHVPAAVSSLPPVQASNAPEAQALIAQLRPSRFKMVHQVAARYQEQSGVMQGYLLGRSDGSFRVSATAAIGPRLFDAVKLNGQLSHKVHLKQISEKLDVLHIARAIDRIYFLGCPDVGEQREDLFVARCKVTSGEDVDEVEVTTSARYLEPVSKRYFLRGAPRLTVTYQDFALFGARHGAKRVQLSGNDGYAIDIALEDYVPQFPFDDALFKLE